jgi:hypothetical protein
MALPFIFAPQWYLDWFGLPGGGGSVIWMRQAGLLLFFISLLYVAGGREPIRYSLRVFHEKNDPRVKLIYQKFQQTTF